MQIDELRAFVRYAVGLPRYLRRPLGSSEARSIVEERLRTRDEAFVAVLGRTVYGHPRSPYRALLLNAGVELGDAARLVRELGVERTLGRLHALGVYVTLDEFKGRCPIERGDGFVLEVRPEDFDSPEVRASFVSFTGGSRGPRRRVMADFDHRADQAVAHRLFLDTFGLDRNPAGFWRTAPPGGGLASVIGFTKAGKRVERWFAPNKLALRPSLLKHEVFTAYTVLASRLVGRPLPFPEHVPITDAVRVAEWLGQKRRERTPALFSTSASSAVRVCLAAEQHGIDISGTFFRLGSEPYTEGKARVLERSGVRTVSNYTMSELGRIGIACATPAALDDLHLLTDRFAVVQREHVVGPGGLSVNALLYTTLLPKVPKVMINVESDDYAVLEERECGCLLGELGLSWHLHGVRSYEKLTSEGMTFVGSELISLLDEVLPARFGGNPTDYQLVEHEVDGLPRVGLVIAPSVGELDEDAVVETVLRVLAAGPPHKAMMAGVWREGNTLRVERREPYVTAAAKILPLHVVEG